MLGAAGAAGFAAIGAAGAGVAGLAAGAVAGAAAGPRGGAAGGTGRGAGAVVEGACAIGACGAGGTAGLGGAGACGAAAGGAAGCFAGSRTATGAGASGSGVPCSRRRTFSATSTVIELECVFFSATPNPGNRSMIAFALTSSSRANSLIRTWDASLILLKNFSLPADPPELCVPLAQPPRSDSPRWILLWILRRTLLR